MLTRRILRNSSLPLRRLREHLRLHRPQVWRLEGAERHSGLPLTLIYAGREPSLRYFRHITFAERPRQRLVGRSWIWRVERVPRTYADTDLLIIETDERHFRRAGAPGDFFIPLWVDGELPCSGLNMAAPGASLGDDLRKIRKHGYGYEISYDPARLVMYHERMYLPYIQRVHADRAALVSLEVLLRKAEQCELLLVREGERHVAGGVSVYEDSQVRSWSLGVLDGDPAHVRKGALAALYYFRMLHLKERGYDRLNAGASRAFLHDGALQYKRKWGMTVTGPRPGGFWLRRRSDSPGALAFLVNNPFIYARDNALHGMAYSIDAAPTEEAWRKLRKLHSGLGLHGFEVATIKTRQGTRYDPSGTGH
jgi:hypothetical protein